MSLFVNQTFSNFWQAHQRISLYTVWFPAWVIGSLPNVPNGNLLVAWVILCHWSFNTIFEQLEVRWCNGTIGDPDPFYSHIYHPSYLGVYQDESEKLEIYLEIDILGGLERNKKNWRNCRACYSYNNKQIKKMSQYIPERWLGIVGFFI